MWAVPGSRRPDREMGEGSFALACLPASPSIVRRQYSFIDSGTRFFGLPVETEDQQVWRNPQASSASLEPLSASGRTD